MMMMMIIIIIIIMCPISYFMEILWQVPELLYARLQTDGRTAVFSVRPIPKAIKK
jgi:hypothetical protein